MSGPKLGAEERAERERVRCREKSKRRRSRLRAELVQIAAERAAAPTVFVFEGRTLGLRVWQGKPCVEARELAGVLAYRDPSDLAQMVARSNGEFIEGVDFARLEGADLGTFAPLKLRGTTEPETGDAMVRSLIVLFESGMYLAAIKARTKIGRRVRRWLAEVLPALSRSGSYQTPAATALPVPEGPKVTFTAKVHDTTAELLRAAAKAKGITPEELARRVLTLWGWQMASVPWR